jgi:hypothetical protein
VPGSRGRPPAVLEHDRRSPPRAKIAPASDRSSRLAGRFVRSTKRTPPGLAVTTGCEARVRFPDAQVSPPLAQRPNTRGNRPQRKRSGASSPPGSTPREVSLNREQPLYARFRAARATSRAAPADNEDRYPHGACGYKPCLPRWGHYRRLHRIGVRTRESS